MTRVSTDDLEQKIVDIAESNGGSVMYDDLRQQLGLDELKVVWHVLSAQTRNRLQMDLVRDESGGLHPRVNVVEFSTGDGE